MTKYVSTDYTGCDYITPGKRYEVVREYQSFVGFEIICDNGMQIMVGGYDHTHTKGGKWTVHDAADETGTLAELNVKPGDVVELVDITSPKEWIGEVLTIGDEGSASNDRINALVPDYDIMFGRKYRLISRESDTPKTWSAMTREEKGALLLAHHEGKEIEIWDDNWRPLEHRPSWVDTCRYRIKPRPVTKTVTMYGRHYTYYWGFASTACEDGDTHRLTFTSKDGEPATGTFRNEAGDVITMERIND